MTKFEACITRLEALCTLGARVVEVYGDLALVISQAQKLWKIREEHFKPYQQC